MRGDGAGCRARECVTSSADQAEISARLKEEPIVALYGECGREGTYGPRLGLVQLGDAHDVAVIDTLAEGSGLTHLADLLDCESCRCSDYEDRLTTVPDCLPLTPQSVREITWLPPTCAYRLVAEGRDLYWWHHLVSGDPTTVHEAGISVRGRAISEEGLAPEEFEDHLAAWPGQNPMNENR